MPLLGRLLLDPNDDDPLADPLLFSALGAGPPVDFLPLVMSLLEEPRRVGAGLADSLAGLATDPRLVAPLGCAVALAAVGFTTIQTMKYNYNLL